ncbi:radical SAM protein [Candidatus Sumerlaeota bacterium]|nr:radical SAM protein [Candidatus Sumerlaeota bacterium]
MSCTHCIQQRIRNSRDSTWINTDRASQALYDAKSLGLTSSGVNFTGGEPFLSGSNLPELLKTAQSLKLNTRINTNAWWGNERHINLGSIRFSSCSHVISWLREMEVAILALSFDKRYDDNPLYWNRIISVIRECENQGQHYQIVITGAKQEEIEHAWCKLTEIEGITPNHMIPVHMEIVDLGAAANLQDKDISNGSSCSGKGFYRPNFLHINPTGGVRTCLYAPGSQWLGNIYTHSLIDICNEFENNFVVMTFCRNTLDQLTDTYLTKYVENGYQLPKHPCASSVLIVRAIEDQHFFEQQKGRISTADESNMIVKSIAEDYNLYDQNFSADGSSE